MTSEGIAGPTSRRAALALRSPEALEPPSTSVPWVYLNSLVFLLSGAVFFLYLAHVLPNASLGAIVILSAIAALMVVVFSLGFGFGFQHFLSFYLGRSNHAMVRTLIRSAMFFALVLSISCAIATFTLSGLFSDIFFHSRSYTSAFSVLAVFSGVQAANSPLRSVLLGLHRFAAYSIVSILASTAMYGLAIGLFWLRPGVDSIVTGWTVGASLGLALAVVAILQTSHPHGVDTIGRDGGNEPGLYRNILAYSLPLFAWSVLATGATYVDRLVLASVADLTSVGVYNYALLIATGTLAVVGPFATLLIPKASKSFGQQNEQGIRALARSAITLIVLVYLPVGLGVAALGPFLLRYLAGPGFVSASIPLMMLLVISALSVPYSILSSIAAGTRRTIAFAKAASLALIANITLSVALVPTFGMIGAAIGNSSMSWVPFLVFYLDLRGSGLIEFDLPSLSRIWLASGAMSIIVGVPLWLANYDPVLVPAFVVLGIVCLAFLLRILKAITTDTAGTLLQFLPRWLAGVRYAVYWLTPTSRPQVIQVTGAAESPLQR